MKKAISLKEDSFMKKIALIAVLALIIFALVLSSCSAGGSDSQSAGTNTGEVTGGGADTSVESTNEDNFDEELESNGDFTVTPGEGAGDVTVSGSTYTITSAGEYTLSGKLEGNIVVNAEDGDEVILILSNATITSSDTAPIVFVNADSGTVKAEEGTYNAIHDERTGSPDAEDADEYDGAIYAACDLKLSGKGSLVITSTYDNGVKTKDDLKVKNVTLKVTVPGNALKGNDSITVESGSLILISTSSDGIKTENSDVSEKGVQRGTVTISGGTVDIYAACDGISAAYDCVISEDEEKCVVNIYTSTYSDNTGDVAVSSDLYVIVPASLYSSSVDYYAYFYNEDGEGVWKLCEYETMVYSGMSASYYGLLVKEPSGYSGFLVCTVASGVTPDGDNFSATSGGEAMNTSMNGYLITSISDSSIEGDWVTLTTSSGQGSSSKTTYSSKGIKVYNDVLISGGTVTVFAMDDAIHANAGEKLENGSAGSGNVEISGGKVTLTSADDGIHADSELTISGGYVNVVKSHEGLEANVINIAGGEIYVYGEDDGLNACKGSSSTLINITGGYLDVTTPSGDTDAIDSNGNITMSDGFVLIKGGSSSGSVAGSVDVDGSITVTGGTVIAFGGICEVPSSGSVNYYVSNGTSFGAGDYVLSGTGGTIASFTLNSSYSSCWIASDELSLNGSYTLTKGGSAVLSWTQSSSASGDQVSGGFGGGGFGPRR